MKNVIELDKVTKHYEGFTLDNVSFQVPKGSIMGFVGENGAGKSTTLKAILGLIQIDGGTVKLFGKERRKEGGEQNNEIGVVLDECCFPDQLRAKDIDTILKKIYKQWDGRMYLDYLKRFNLPLDKPIKEFSKGMKMKLSISSALSHKPKLLIMDEATSGLDPIVRDEMLEIFQEFIEDEEHSILLSSHITSDLEKIADYITFIHKGKIRFSENKDILLERYGIVRCGRSEYERLDPSHVKGVRKCDFGMDVLVDNRDELLRKNRNLVVDKTAIDDIMLLLVKGIER